MKGKYRNTAFMVELLVNILVFSISCAVLVGLFGKAGEMSRNTREEAFASTETLRLVEIVKARGIEGLADGQKQPDGAVLCLYDEEWQAVAQAGAYRVRLVVESAPTKAGSILNVKAEATRADGALLYTVNTADYTPREGAAA